MAERLLPLFPLEVVLFPGMHLPLHVFEPRYRRLISECLEASAPFGVILETAGERADVGCTASIVEVLRRYPDGKLDVLTEGRQRFRILELDEALPYLRARIEWLPQENEDVQSERTTLLDLYRRTYWVHGQGLAPSALEAAPSMSYVVARSSLLDLEDRQRLLEMPTERGRLEALAKALGALEPVIRAVGGNGHRTRMVAHPPPTDSEATS